MIEPTDVDWTGYRSLSSNQKKSIPGELFVAECGNCFTILRYHGSHSQLGPWRGSYSEGTYLWPCCGERFHLNPDKPGGCLRTGVLKPGIDKAREVPDEQAADAVAR